jgi:RNA polymerase sigma-54 factor
LDLRQSQSLVMTPQLQQAIKLLQMSNLELNTYVEQELEQNPLLEFDETDGGLDSPADAPDGEPRDASAGEDGATGDGSSDDAPEVPNSAELATSETLQEGDSAALDTDYENVWEPDTPTDGGLSGGGDASQWSTRGNSIDVDDPDFDSIAARDVTLREHLQGQVNVDLADPVDRMIAAHLIEMLDDAGYLSGDLTQVAVALGCDIERVELTLERVKRFDPSGIFARNLAECLALQLLDKNRLDSAMVALLDNLDLLAKRDFNALRRACGVDTEDIADMIREIKALNPKPASAFDHVVAQPVTPDVMVRRQKSVGWVVELNNDTLPRVLVNSRYFAVVREKSRRKEEQQYLIERLQSANWLVKSLQQRAETILKVATELVHMQEDFFTNGVQHLRPLTLRDVAQEVGVHESTVSRVTNGKYIGIWRGVYEMKYFFTAAVGQNPEGDFHSAESVRHKIKDLVDAETADTVLSDDRIVEMLSADGVDIARRTVAKYRETMRIPSSIQRRRERALQA